MARVQCKCGTICRSRTTFKIHVRTLSRDGTIHEQVGMVSRFKNVGPNKVDKRKERDKREAELNGIR